MSEEKKAPLRTPKGPMGPHAMGIGKPKNTKLVIKRLLGRLKDSRLKLFFVMILMLIGSISMLTGSYFLKPLINNYILPGDFAGLAKGLIILACIYLIGSAAIYLQSRIMVKVAQKTVNSLRKDVFEHMQSLSLRYFDSHTHGELMSRYTNDMDNVQMALEQSLVQLFSSALTFIGVIVMMIVLSPLLFVVTAVIIALMLFLSSTIGKRSRTYFQKQQKEIGNLNGYIEEMVEGLKEVKVFTHEQQANQGFYKINDQFFHAASNANFFAGIIMPIMVNLNNICFALSAVFGGILVIKGSFDIGSLAAFLQYSRQVGHPINQISMQLNNVFAAMAGAERIFELLDEEPEIDEGRVTLVTVVQHGDDSLEIAPAGQHTGHWAWKKGEELIPLRGDVRFHNVTFAYDGINPVLKNVSLFAKPGQKIAFVGSTGAGKTTITNLINRFYDIQEGEITYDGINVREIKKDDLRQSLGMVLQDTHLFTGTVMENIRYGRLDATDEECIEAAHQASADSFISRLPQGYDTVITGDGANLSQGQRQLLAIARSYVADPPVMILDEATSSIDTRTERLIEKGMNALMEDRTVFVIAHRLSTVRNANAILVLENGQIIERGDHADLLEQKGRYWQLYTGQHQLD